MARGADDSVRSTHCLYWQDLDFYNLFVKMYLLIEAPAYFQDIGPIGPLRSQRTDQLLNDPYSLKGEEGSWKGPLKSWR
ncbi:hypothetical protein LZ554_000761 [Drepanopeziza brunnea f. sp. 'monogermtubi']|nr:hypothetical protein LZ554_000761 [Drepanopeziza brunnea f. sp. 'monogermtubi']